MPGVTEHAGRCAICAAIAPRTAKYDQWAGSLFTDHNKVKHWGAERICEPCVWAHSWTPPPGYPAQAEGRGVNLRLFTHLWDARGYHYANKGDKPLIREWLRGPHPGPWFAAIADSGQKHVLPWTRMNGHASRAVVRFDEREVVIGHWGLVDALTDLLTDGVTKDELGPGDYRLLSYQQSGEAVQTFEERFGCLRGSGWFALALWLSQRNEDEWQRRQDGRKAERTLARPDRDAGTGRAKRVPGGRRECASPLGPTQGPDEIGSEHERKHGGVGDGTRKKPESRGPEQLSLFGD